MGPGMMYGDSSSAPDWWNGSWSSMMGPAAAASEPEYLAAMIAHHREAVAAARELARSDRPQMRAFGESVVETQTSQIEQMLRTLPETLPLTVRRNPDGTVELLGRRSTGG